MPTKQSNKFQSPEGAVSFAILHEPRRWDEVKGKSEYCEPEHPKAEYSVGLIIGDEEGQTFKTRVDGFLNKEANELITSKFDALKPKQKEKYKDALAWNAEVHAVNIVRPYYQLEDEEGNELEGWCFTFKRKSLMKWFDKETKEKKEALWSPKFWDVDGNRFDDSKFDREGKIGNDSTMRISFSPYVWTLGDKIGLKLDIHDCLLVNYIPYTSNGNAKQESPFK